MDCHYYRGVVCGRCEGCHKGHGICTLNTKVMTTGKPMKGPAAEKKAVAFRGFMEALRAQGKPTPTLAIWDPRRNTFIADLETFDGQVSAAHADLVAWVRARNQAMAEGKSLPEYKGDREPRKGKGKGKKVTKTVQKADQADQAEETGDELDRMNVDEPEQAAPPAQRDAPPRAAGQEDAAAKVIAAEPQQQVAGTRVSEDAQVGGKGKEPERPDPAFAQANRQAIPAGASAEKAEKPSTEAPPADALGLGLTGLSLEDPPKADFDFTDYDDSQPQAGGSKSKGLYIEISDSEPGPSKPVVRGQRKRQLKPVVSPPIDLTDDEPVAKVSSADAFFIVVTHCVASLRHARLCPRRSRRPSLSLRRRSLWVQRLLRQQTAVTRVRLQAGMKLSRPPSLSPRPRVKPSGGPATPSPLLSAHLRGRLPASPTSSSRISIGRWACFSTSRTRMVTRSTSAARTTRTSCVCALRLSSRRRHSALRSSRRLLRPRR